MRLTQDDLLGTARKAVPDFLNEPETFLHRPVADFLHNGSDVHRPRLRRSPCTSKTPQISTCLQYNLRGSASPDYSGRTDQWSWGLFLFTRQRAARSYAGTIPGHSPRSRSDHALAIP